MTRPKLRLLYFAGACLVLASMWGAASLPAHAQQPQPVWTACGDGFECATLAVPVDYSRPAERTIELALIRLPASDPSRRIGSFMLNPGGPGASAVEFARSFAPLLSDEIRARFDIVGFDPRGVGASAPLLCHDDIQELGAMEPEPETQAQWDEIVRTTGDLADLCDARGGDLLPHLGSLNVARDMDRVREALGDQQATYLGFSYGTVIGALYADRFPDRVRALVLDGAVDIGPSGEELMTVQAVGLDRAFERFVADCRARNCALGTDPAAAIDALQEQARATPIPAPGADRPAGPGEIHLAMVAAMYRPRTWPSLEQALVAARDGDASMVVQFADLYLGRRGGEYDNSYEMGPAINCLDYALPRDIRHYQTEFVDEVTRVAPEFGRSFAQEGLICAQWESPPAPISLTGARGAAPVLVVGTTNDPATPFEWAVALSLDLPSGVLLTHEGDGHTAYLLGNRCIDDTIDNYLLTLAVPEDGAICGATDAVPRPPPTPPAAAAASMAGPSTAPAESAQAEATTDEAWRSYLAFGVIGVAVLAVVAVFVIAQIRGRRT
jgi:pimeloyl-ACP methyl ester carboxylesterase